MVKKGEKGVPRSPETREKIGISSKERLLVKSPCPFGCEGLFNHGNLATHISKYHTFVCLVDGCISTAHKGLGYCYLHYNLNTKYLSYGSSLESVIEIYNSQLNKCAICDRKGYLAGTGAERMDVLVVDHCHTTNKYRGLLCNRCNLGIGHFLDNPDTLESAAKYLRRFNE